MEQYNTYVVYETSIDVLPSKNQVLHKSCTHILNTVDTLISLLEFLLSHVRGDSLLRNE